MKQKTWLIHFLQLLAIAGLTALLFYEIDSSTTPVKALPEYAHRTGESCAVCHVDPGGGGPRTLRGAFWAAKGRPDQVPDLPGVLLAPGVKDGAELYEIACGTCHGRTGEGLFGREIANSGLNEAKIRSNILKGRLQSGMPAFDGAFTPEQLKVLVDFNVALADGTAKFSPKEYPLAPPILKCSPQTPSEPCGGN